MVRSKRWKDEVKDGVMTVHLTSWKHFHDYIRQEMLDYNHYVWRGDRCDNRLLQPSFDRIHKGKSEKFIESRASTHLEYFKLATRGRRGPFPSKIETENDWWALGQHHGLTTPLLDWTRSPFVALFFAFEKEKKPQTDCRAVYAITPSLCRSKSKEVSKLHIGPGRPDILDFFTPFQDENNRLVNQNGLFSRCTFGKPVENWISEKFKGDNETGILIKIIIPNKERDECLRTLNKMNINHLTLYPDLYGASSFCNFTDLISKY